MAQRTELLPPNATQLQIDLVHSIYENLRGNIELVKLLRDFNYGNLPDSILTAALNDAGLGVLARYISDPRQALQQGREWQRSRGTIYAVNLALSWLFRDDEFLDNTPWFRTVSELRLTSPLASAEELRRIVTLTRLSSRATTTLARVYRGTTCPAMDLNSEATLCDSLLNVPEGEWDEDLQLWVAINEEDSGEVEDLYDPEVLGTATLSVATEIDSYPDSEDLNDIPIATGDGSGAVVISSITLIEQSETVPISDSFSIADEGSFKELNINVTGTVETNEI
ncbi:hypothetical protein [Cognatishimia sp.]|uniref:hypothetical protein n=1 Tax=Cognatishimia sp. TaxID=2211648 RepID=UPI0035114A41|nr:hypothetical protein [Cognatishimia sp.]